MHMCENVWCRLYLKFQACVEKLSCGILKIREFGDKNILIFRWIWIENLVRIVIRDDHCCLSKNSVAEAIEGPYAQHMDSNFFNKFQKYQKYVCECFDNYRWINEVLCQWRTKEKQLLQYWELKICLDFFHTDPHYPEFPINGRLRRYIEIHGSQGSRWGAIRMFRHATGMVGEWRARIHRFYWPGGLEIPGTPSREPIDRWLGVHRPPLNHTDLSDRHLHPFFFLFKSPAHAHSPSFPPIRTGRLESRLFQKYTVENVIVTMKKKKKDRNKIETDSYGGYGELSLLMAFVSWVRTSNRFPLYASVI